MTPDPTALEAAARALYEQVRVHQPIAWEALHPLLQEDVRSWARETVQAYLDALPKP